MVELRWRFHALLRIRQIVEAVRNTCRSPMVVERFRFNRINLRERSTRSFCECDICLEKKNGNQSIIIVYAKIKLHAHLDFFISQNIEQPAAPAEQTCHDGTAAPAELPERAEQARQD